MYLSNMSPPNQTNVEYDDMFYGLFGNLTTILYLSCCCESTENIKHAFHDDDGMNHTSSVVREVAWKLLDFFDETIKHCPASELKQSINDFVLETIMSTPRVGGLGIPVSQEVAMYVRPYIINQMCLRYGENDAAWDIVSWLLSYTELDKFAHLLYNEGEEQG